MISKKAQEFMNNLPAFRLYGVGEMPEAVRREAVVEAVNIAEVDIIDKAIKALKLSCTNNKDGRCRAVLLLSGDEPYEKCDIVCESKFCRPVIRPYNRESREFENGLAVFIKNLNEE